MSERGLRVVSLEPVTAPRVERAFSNRLARCAHEPHEKMYIVQREKPWSEHLVGHEKVAEVGSGEARAGGARAGLVQRAVVGAELGVADVDSPFGDKGRPVASHARGRDAV